MDAILTDTTIQSLAEIGLPVHRFTVAEYHQLANSGAIRPDARVELLEGCIFDMTPIGSAHASSVQRTLRSLLGLPLTGYYVRVQQPITLSTSEPQPDLAVVRDRADDYAASHPGPADVELVIEIADTTLQLDRERKSRIYAESGIPAYWIVNLVDRRIETFAEPRLDSVTGVAVYDRTSSIGESGELNVRIAGTDVGLLRAADLLTIKR